MLSRQRFKVVFAAICGALVAGAGLSVATAAQKAHDAPRTATSHLAFPGALGWAATTPGGRGGQVIRVTTLAAEGPGSFREAVETKGPRIIVFEVGGVVDMGGKTLTIREPFLTIAGQTAPSPGVTFIKGGIDIATHDVVVQHIRVRPGEAGAAKKSGKDFDSISTQGISYNIIVDHCTLTWGTDENLSASGPRFVGQTPDDWRAGTSRNITFSNNIIAESLRYSTHAKIEHSKGSLIHDNITGILIVGNLYAHNFERNPMFKGGVRGVVVNNLIYNPGQRAIHYNLMAEEWGDKPWQIGQLVAVGNVLRGGMDTAEHLAFLEIGGYGDLEFYGKDNIAQDRYGRPLPMFGRYTTAPAKIIQKSRPMLWPPGLVALPASAVQQSVLGGAGARPWDRDALDVQLISDVAEGRGAIIDSENDLHGYPAHKETRRPFNPDDWNLFDMTPKRRDVLDAGAKAKGT
ncbi:pectate lyase [Caulobacter sp. SLTY]|uniref:pectate lyase family protein n=1 Tax=Caulobacter sp. SLTY TaxID=2683262 RepID=UPI001412A164|nr:pectate lyase [Caulobacter sp. SLTY]NBB16792.1 pectate lyase [Caulobacter sp. SLTY]